MSRGFCRNCWEQVAYDSRVRVCPYCRAAGIWGAALAALVGASVYYLGAVDWAGVIRSVAARAGV